jgi:hypothetical protein
MTGSADRAPGRTRRKRTKGEVKTVGVKMRKEELALLKAFMTVHTPPFRSRSVALRRLLEPGLEEARRTIAGAPLAQRKG